MKEARCVVQQNDKNAVHARGARRNCWEAAWLAGGQLVGWLAGQLALPAWPWLGLGAKAPAKLGDGDPFS